MIGWRKVGMVGQGFVDVEMVGTRCCRKFVGSQQCRQLTGFRFFVEVYLKKHKFILILIMFLPPPPPFF